MVSSLDTEYDSLQEIHQPPLMRKAASAHVQPPSLEDLALHDSSGAGRTNGSHHPRDLPLPTSAVGASMPAHSHEAQAQASMPS